MNKKIVISDIGTETEEDFLEIRITVQLLEDDKEVMFGSTYIYNDNGNFEIQDCTMDSANYHKGNMLFVYGTINDKIKGKNFEEVLEVLKTFK